MARVVFSRQVLLCLYLLQAAILFRHVCSEIDIDQRTRGIPMSDTHEGNKFCFSFAESLTNPSGAKYLSIYIGTMESTSVQYRIRSGVTGVNKTGTVGSGEIKMERYTASGTDQGSIQMIPVLGSDSRNERTGIIVETINSTQKISVSAFSDATASQDGFTAVPMINVTTIVPNFQSKYVYAGFTTDSTASGFLITVACDTIEAGGVTLNNGLFSLFGVFQFFPSGTFDFSRKAAYGKLEEYNTAVLFQSGSTGEQMSGFLIEATQPVGVMTGHQCGNVPLLGTASCDHMVEQIPPSYTWGYNFFMAPFSGRTTGYLIRIVPRYDNTNFNIRCSGGTDQINMTVTNYQRSQRLTSNRGTFIINSQSYCCIQSDRPLAIMQYCKGHQDDDNTAKEQNLGDPCITWVPAVSQYLNKHLFSNKVALHPLDEQRVTYYGIYVTVLDRYFNTSAITINGTALQPDSRQWSRILCYGSTRPCGYGLSIRMDASMQVGTHLIAHSDPSASVNVGVYGWGNQKGFAFPAGFGMNPVGETFYSIQSVISSANESSRGPVTAVVYKSGDLTQSSYVIVSTYALSGSNAAQIGNGQDLVSQQLNVSFAPGESSKTVSFNFNDDTETETNETFGARIQERSDIFLGNPSTTSFTIIDDDFVDLTIRFNPVNYTTIEGDVNTTVYVNATTSERVKEDTVIRITDIPINGGATRNVDYTGFNRLITIPAGESSFSFPVTILSNSQAEPTERFDVRMQRESGGLITITGGDATVNIQDRDVISVSFVPSTYTVQEGSTSKIVTIKGRTSQALPSSSVIRLTDVQILGGATRNVDYQSFNQTITLQPGQRDFEFNVTVLSNVETEPTELFQVNMAYESGNPLTVTGGNAMVNIEDATVLQLSSSNYIVNENDRVVTINITASKPVRSDTVVFIRTQPNNPLQANDSDYDSVNVRNVQIPQGQSYVTYNIPIKDDDIPEPTEKFKVQFGLVSGTSVVVDPTRSTSDVTITDPDRSTITYSPIIVTTPEQEEKVVLTLVVEKPYFEPFNVSAFSVPFTDTNVAAIGGVDYISFNRTLTINGGRISFTEVIINDTIAELAEEFGVRVKVLGDARVDVIESQVDRAKVVISDDDTITIGFEKLVFEFDEPETGNKNEQLKVIVTGNASFPFTVGLNYFQGTATRRDDYSDTFPTASSVSIPVNSTEAVFDVQLKSDNLDENNENFTVLLTVPQQYASKVTISTPVTTVVIRDSDSVTYNINATISDSTIPEDRSARICVTRSGAIPTQPQQLTLQPSSGTATAGQDFNGNTITFTMQPNETTVCRSVPVIDDNLALEDPETFKVTLTSTTPGLVGSNNNITVTITDNDESNAFFVSPQYSDDEGKTVLICVNITKPIAKATTINLMRGNYSATLTDADFNLQRTSLTFRPNSDQQECFNVIYTNDTIVEGIERGQISLVPTRSTLIGVDPSRNRTTIEIKDTDTAVIEFAENRYRYPENVGRGEVCVRTTNVLSTDVSIRFMTDDSSPANATAGQDYDTLVQTKTLPAGEREVCFDVKINEDNQIEQNEYFFGRFSIPDMTQLQNTYGSRVTVRSSDPTEVFIYDPSGCTSVVADIMLLLDESRSISNSDYRIVKNFSISLLDSFPVSANGTHVGIIKFSNDERTKVESQLGAVTDVTALKSIIRNLDESDNRGGRGGTFHLKAMQLAVQQLSRRARNDSQKVIILITDGVPDPTSQSAINESREARGRGYDIFGVGIFEFFPPEDLRKATEELRQITGRSDRVTVATNFGALNSSLASILLRQVCPEASFVTENVIVNENNGTVTVCLRREGDLTNNIPLVIKTQERNPPQANDATGNMDFPVVTIRNRVYPSGTTRQCYQFNITNDNIGGEPNEVFQVVFNSSSTAPAIANVTIVDDDTLTATFERTPYRGTEGTVLQICAVLSHVPATSPVTVPLRIDGAPSGLDQAENTDYSGVPNSVTFTTSSQKDCFNVTLRQDSIYERQEAFQISLVFPNNDNVQPGRIPRTTVLIDDANTPILTGGGPKRAIGPNVTTDEGMPAVVCITLTGTGTTSTEVPIPLTFTPTRKSNAPDPAEDTDYDTRPVTTTLNPGQTEVCVNISTTRDIEDENDEQFCVNVTSSDSNIMFNPRSCQIMVTIKDNKRCITYHADIMLVIDESTSIGSGDMIRARNFAVNLVKAYRVSTAETNIGLIRFSTNERTRVDIPVNQHTSTSELVAAIERINFADSLRGDKTHHMDAIELALKELRTNGRPRVKDFIILVTDGHPEPVNQSARAIADAARVNGTSVYGIYVGNTQEDLDEITAVSDPGRVFTITNFAALDSVLDDVIRRNCSSTQVTFVTENVKVNEDNGTVRVCLRKEGESLEDVTLTIYTKQRHTPAMYGDAQVGKDFPQDIRKDVVFRRPDSIKCFDFNITDDNIGEIDEVFQIMFNITSDSLIAYTDRPTANITICDNDPTGLSFTSMDYCVNEDVGSVRVCVEKNRTTEYDIPVTIDALQDDPFKDRGSARRFLLFFGDFVMDSKTEILRAQNNEICVNFTIVDDKIALEGNETFTLRFTATPPSLNTSVTQSGSSKVTIKDNDQLIVDVMNGTDTFNRNVTVPESQGNVTICVNRTNPIAYDVNATFTPIERTSGSDRALSGQDFVLESKTVLFRANATVVCATFKIIDDDIVEKNETFLVNVTLPTHVPPVLQAVVTITDEGDTAVIEFNSTRYRFPETIGTGRVCVRSSKPLSGNFSIRLTTNSNSPANATAGRDYVAHDESKTLIAGQTVLCYDVRILADDIPELDEFFFGNFSMNNMAELVDCYGSRVTVRSSDPTEVFIYDPSGCEAVIADMMILLDESRSISNNQYVTIKDFSILLLDSFPVSANGTHIGLVKFSNNNRTTVESQLGAVTDVTALKSIIRNLDESDNRGGIRGTYHLKAMQLAVRELRERGRSDSRKIIILITDGVPDPTSQSAINESRDARQLGYDIFAVGIFVDESVRISGTRELERVTGRSDRLTVLENFGALNSSLANIVLGQVCPGNTTNETVCIVQDPLKVTPFHSEGRVTGMYNFHGICEHVLAKPCNDTSFIIVSDFLSRDLSMGRVGIKVPSGFVLIDEGLNIRNSTPFPQGITVSMTRDTNGNVTMVTLQYTSREVRIERTRTEIKIFAKSGTLCGLCGSLDGVLVSSDGMMLNDLMNQTKVNTFANSWRQPANEQILREDRRECAVIKNDTIIGDPLFEAALWVGQSTCNYSLCYEIHGSSGQHYNLLSDMCVSVNAYYTAMRNPSDGNIISAIGIRASDDTDSCVNIDIVQDQTTGQCVTSVNGGTALNIGGEYNSHGINVKQRMSSRVRVGVPNCERVPLIMWVTCQNMSGELMMRFDISRAVNLRPSSHGLLGQFYNIRMQAQRFTNSTIIGQLDPRYYDINNLWTITVTPPNGSPTRRFVAELYERTWDNSRSPCLYAGTSQGGAAVEFEDMHRDSVIEGHYTHYQVASRFATNFAYERFDETRC